MRGFPTSFATKQDYLNSLSMYPEQTKTELRRLLSDRFVWEKTKELKSESAGVTNDTHRVLETTETDEKTREVKSVFIQLEKKEDENAALFRLGFTVKEVQNLIA